MTRKRTILIGAGDIVLAKQGIDPWVTDLATKIKRAQDPETKQMQDWLMQWGNPPGRLDCGADRPRATRRCRPWLRVKGTVAMTWKACPAARWG